MNEHEQHRVVSVCASPPSWPLVGRPWPRASKCVHYAIPFDPYDVVAACAARQTVGKLSDCQLRATVGVPLDSPGTPGAPGTKPIQYP